MLHASQVTFFHGMRTNRELSELEVMVLQCAADGMINREIGRQMNVSEHTARTHMARIMCKLEAKNRAHAVALGIRRGLIT